MGIFDWLFGKKKENNIDASEEKNKKKNKAKKKMGSK